MPRSYRHVSSGEVVTVPEPGDEPVRDVATRARRIARLEASSDWERVTDAGGRPAGDAREPDGTVPAPTTREVRAWAKEQGIDVPARGRVPDSVFDAYQAAQAGGEV